MSISTKGVKIYNNLDNLNAVQNTPIGPNGVPSGTVTFPTGYFQGAAYTADLRTNKIKHNDASILLADANAFAVGYWGKPNYACVNGVSPGNHMTWGITPTGSLVAGSNAIVFTSGAGSYWYDGGTTKRLTTGGGLNFSSGIWQYFRFVKDRNGIDGSGDHFRIYIDGVLGWSLIDLPVNSATNMKSVTIGAWDEVITGAGGLDTEIDEFKVWDYANTDFSGIKYLGFNYANKRKF